MQTRPSSEPGMQRKASLFAMLLLLFAATSAMGHGRNQSSVYLYEDTRQLVEFVESAAELIELKGEKAFAEFGVRGSRWFNDTRYLFVYDLEATNLFHPITPELLGKNTMDIRDANGRPISQWATAIGRRPERNASGWIFYLWEENIQFTPSWKSAYIRKAITPGGRTCVVGSGLYNLRVEKVFVQQRVDEAAELLLREGREKAFARFLDPASPFQFLGTYIFVLSSTGRTIVDPAFPTMGNRDMTRFNDATGRPIVSEILRKLKEGDTNTVWMQYMQPKIGSLLPARKLVYARRVYLGDEWVIVGADFFLATPIWMKF